MKFGVSPFGIWRPGHPKGIEAGADSFKDLAANSKRWINKGWVDYLAPQLYWPIDQLPQSFSVLLDWWIEQNFEHRHIWPGVYTTNEASKGFVGTDEIINQVNMSRDKLAKNKAGHIHFTMNTLLDNTSNMTTSLKDRVYQNPTITPSYSNIKSNPSPPILIYNKKFHKMKIVILKDTTSQSLIIKVLNKKHKWHTRIVPAYNINKYKLKMNHSTKKVTVQILDRYGNLSDKTVLATV